MYPPPSSGIMRSIARLCSPHSAKFLAAVALILAACGGGDPAAPTPPPPSRTLAKALWVNRFEYSSAEGIRQIIGRAADAGFTLVFFQVRGMGDAYYASDLEPCAAAVCGRLGGSTMAYDPLAVAVETAHARGIALHAWVNALSAVSSPSANNESFCANVERASDPGEPTHVLLAHPDWAMVSSAGVRMSCRNSTAYEYAYLSPAIPEVRGHIARVTADIARRYAVDGIHLDRIRYPGQFHSSDAPALEEFRRISGRAPTSSTSDPEWIQFRRDQVTHLVRAIRDSVRAARPGALLSAAVWGIYEDRWGWGTGGGFTHYFQDPRAWITNGLLDIVVPMTYSASATSASFQVTAQHCTFADWLCLLDDHLARVRQSGSAKLYIGIGANRPFAEIKRQIDLARDRRADGIAIYAYSAVNNAGLWTLLKEEFAKE